MMLTNLRFHKIKYNDRLNISNSFSLYIILLLSLFFNNTSLAENKQDNSNIILSSELYPPYVYQNEQGKMIGILVDELTTIFNATGLDYNFKYYPWKRGLKVLNQNNNMFIFPMTRSAKRENSYQWVLPLHTINLHLYGLKSKFNSPNIDVTTGKFTVSCVEKTIMCNALYDFGFPDKSITEMSSAALNHSLTMLLRERIDLMLLSKEELAFFKDKMDLNTSKLIKINSYNYQIVEYLVSNLKTDDKLIKKIRDSAKQLEIIK